MEALLKNIYLIKKQLKLIIIFNTLLSIGILIISPLVLGIKYLDPLASANVLEKYVSLIGIILITPLFFPEQDKDISELIQVKYISPNKIMFLRLILSLIILFLLVTVMISVMHYNGCEFPFTKYLLFTFITAMFLGALGFAGAGISNNLIVGYFLPAVYYILNLGIGIKLGNFYLFSMSIGSCQEKYYLLAMSITLFLLVFLTNTRFHYIKF